MIFFWVRSVERGQKPGQEKQLHGSEQDQVAPGNDLERFYISDQLSDQYRVCKADTKW